MSSFCLIVAMECEDCNVACPTEEPLSAHQKCHRRVDSDNGSGGVLKEGHHVYKCGKKYMWEKNLKRHMKESNTGCPKIGGPICFLNNFAYLKPNSMPSGRMKIEIMRSFLAPRRLE